MGGQLKKQRGAAKYERTRGLQRKRFGRCLISQELGKAQKSRGRHPSAQGPIPLKGSLDSTISCKHSAKSIGTVGVKTAQLHKAYVENEGYARIV